MTIISSPNMLELFPAFFFCSYNFNPSENSLGSDENHIVFDQNWFLRDPAMMAGDSSNLVRDLSLVLFLPEAFSSKFSSLANSNIGFLSVN